MKITLHDLRLVGVLVLYLLTVFGTVITAVKLVPSLAALWTIIMVFCLLGTMPLALWLDKSMRR